MQEDIDFFELVIIQRIEGKKDNTYIEKLAPEISTSFFEVANRIGSLKIKGYVDLKPSLGMSEVILTPAARDVLIAANKKAEEKNTDIVDREILKNISNGFNELSQIQEKMKIKGLDLALHLHKLYVNSFIDYSVSNNTAKFLLTEKGFTKAHNEKKTAAESSQAPQKEQQKETSAEEKPKDQGNVPDSETSSEDVKTIMETPEKKEEGIKQYDSKMHYLLEKYKWQILVTLVLLMAILGVIVYKLYAQKS